MVWKEEVSGEVEMAVSDIPLMLNRVWKSNQRGNRLFIISEVEWFKFVCFCSGINVEHYFVMHAWWQVVRRDTFQIHVNIKCKQRVSAGQL